MLGDDIDTDRFARAWRGRYQPAMQRIRSGSRDFIKLDDLHKENLVDTLDEFGIDGLSEGQIDQLNLAWHKLDPWPDVVPAMHLLRPQFFLAPCSNGNTGLMVRLARHTGFMWDTILGAEPAQDYKPQLSVYLTAARWLDLQPAEVMMVATHNDDLKAAQKAGLQTAFFPRPDEHGVEHGIDQNATGDWDIVATDLLDLAAQFDLAQH